jgi:hypothetical protein
MSRNGVKRRLMMLKILVIGPSRIRSRLPLLLLAASTLVLFGPGYGEAGQEATTTAYPLSGGEKQGESLTEVNKQLTNPISNVWSLTVQQNNYLLNKPHAWNSELQFEPILPVALTKDWNLVTRPVFMVFNSTPYINSAGNSARETGLGDSTLVMMLSPNTSNWQFGLGPTFTLPTATTQQTGQGKWQAGPAAVFGYLSKSFLLAFYPQQWWSIAGQGDRSATDRLQLQYYGWYFWGDGWAIGLSPNILVNWESSSGQKLTFPVGLGLSKVVNVCGVPVKFGIQGQYMAVRPDNSGQEWNIQLQITPRLPPLIQGLLF